MELAPRSLLFSILPVLNREFPHFACFLMSGNADPIDAILPPRTLPEPGSIALAACGALPLAGVILRRRRRA